MKSFLSILLMLLFLSCASSVYRVRVLEFPGQPVGNRYDTVAIKKIRVDIWSDSIVMKLKNKRKLILSPKDIWGFQDADGTIWRYETGRFVSVKQLDTPTIYSTKHSSGKSSHNHYYFSKTPYSPVYSFRWKFIKTEFADNPCFLSRLQELNFFQSYDAYDNKTKSYRFGTLYKECAMDRSIEKPR